MDQIIKNAIFYFLSTTFVALYASSFICLIIHLRKFFQTKTPQTLATKNLTLYCFFVLLIYVYVLVLLLNYFKFDFMSNFPIIFIYTYLTFNATFVKLIIALDICLCFRKTALYLQKPSGSQNKKFLIYLLVDISLPLLYIILLKFFFLNPITSLNELYAYLIEPTKIIRTIRLIPIFGAFWYIKLASIDKTELKTKYSLHMRLLIMLGGFSTLLTFTELFFDQFIAGVFRYDDRVLSLEEFYAVIHFLGTVLEGVVIGACFTFKKGTFQSSSSATATTATTPTTPTSITSTTSC